MLYKFYNLKINLIKKNKLIFELLDQYRIICEKDIYINYYFLLYEDVIFKWIRYVIMEKLCYNKYLEIVQIIIL